MVHVNVNLAPAVNPYKVHVPTYNSTRMNISMLSTDQWASIIPYLGTEDFMALRIAGNKAMGLSQPNLTRHLQLRIDRTPFLFVKVNANHCHCFSEKYIREWLVDRTRLVINDADVKLCPLRMAYFIANGMLNAVSEVIVHDCHYHGAIIELFPYLPNLKSLILVDQGDSRQKIDVLDNIIAHVANMHSLTTLDIEFDTVIHGSRLSFLEGMQALQHLRLMGFDLSEGIRYMRTLKDLETLQLCHGNFYSSPNEDVNEKGLNNLTGLTKLRRLHLEGFDCLSCIDVAPLSSPASNIRDFVMKHCQEPSDDCLASIGRMIHLNSLHFVFSLCDDFEVFESESLQRLNTLSALKCLSLFYVLEDPCDLRLLPGLTALETLNLAFNEALDIEETEDLLTTALQTFPSLQKVRIFSEDCMECTFQYAGLDVEYATFCFGDLVYLD